MGEMHERMRMASIPEPRTPARKGVSKKASLLADFKSRHTSICYTNVLTKQVYLYMGSLPCAPIPGF